MSHIVSRNVRHRVISFLFESVLPIKHRIHIHFVTAEADHFIYKVRSSLLRNSHTCVRHGSMNVWRPIMKLHTTARLVCYNIICQEI